QLAVAELGDEGWGAAVFAVLLGGDPEGEAAGAGGAAALIGAHGLGFELEGFFDAGDPEAVAAHPGADDDLVARAGHEGGQLAEIGLGVVPEAEGVDVDL